MKAVVRRWSLACDAQIKVYRLSKQDESGFHFCFFVDVLRPREPGVVWVLLLALPTTKDRRPTTAFLRFAISTAACAASDPLLPIFSPARSIACSRVSQVRTPNA